MPLHHGRKSQGETAERVHRIWSEGANAQCHPDFQKHTPRIHKTPRSPFQAKNIHIFWGGTVDPIPRLQPSLPDPALRAQNNSSHFNYTSGFTARPTRHTAGPSSARPLYMLLLQSEYPSPDTRQCHALSLVDIGARSRTQPQQRDSWHRQPSPTDS